MTPGIFPIVNNQCKQVGFLSFDTVDSLGTSEGVIKELCTAGISKKFLGKRIRDNKIGMVKKSVSPDGYDNINEVLCYHLGKLFGVRVCEASTESYSGSNHWVISIYEYDISKDTITSCKNAFGVENFHKRFSMSSLKKMFGQEAVDDFGRMVIFDTITHQTDRHIRNFSFFNNRMYPLYDNGRCLFWDTDSLEPISQMDLISTFETNEHGYGWSYLDGVLGPQECKQLINPNVTYQQLYDIVSEYYTTERAKVLSRYMYMTYKLIIGGSLNEC